MLAKETVAGTPHLVGLGLGRVQADSLIEVLDSQLVSA